MDDRDSLDRRIRRTRDRLGDALIELLRERPFEAIRVQDVLERAEVGRSTFYAHFSGKEDLLLSDVDEFLGHMASSLERSGERSPRVAPVRELFAHVAGQRDLWDAFARADKLQDFLDLAQAHFARGIEERLRTRPLLGELPPSDRTAQAQALAGALVALLAWWIRAPDPAPPERMERLFHALVPRGAPG